jgi:hypothetical protein
VALSAGVVAAAVPGDGPMVDTAVTSTADQSTTLSATDAEDLLYMRQEEKLAGDVYQVLYDRWGARVFANINRSELTHQSTVADLMAGFGIDDPVAELAPGEFLDPDLQALYDELVERGTASLEEALKVGAYIEELDIADLREKQSGVTAIDIVYDRLEQASHNHLRAFVRNLDRLGVDYEPVVLDDDLYQEIIDETGPGRAGRGGRGQGIQDRGAQTGPMGRNADRNQNRTGNQWRLGWDS